MLPSSQAGLGARRISFASDRTAGPAAGQAIMLSGGGKSAELSLADLGPVELQEKAAPGTGPCMSPGQSFGGYQAMSMLSHIQGQ